MSGLIELAARVEALDGRNTGGDMTLLTSEIARALGWVRVTPSEARNKSGHWVAPEDCRNGRPVYDSLHGTEVHRSPPLWLWSLDAAMTLVPKGWHTGAYYQGPSGQPHRWILRTIRDGETFYRDREAKAATPALALVAAALRARASTEGEG